MKKALFKNLGKGLTTVALIGMNGHNDCMKQHVFEVQEATTTSGQRA